MDPSHTSTAAAAGLSGAALVIIDYTLGQWGIKLPSEVTAAGLTLFIPAAHWAVLTVGAKWNHKAP